MATNTLISVYYFFVHLHVDMPAAQKPTCFGIVHIVFIDKDLVKRYGSRAPHRTSQCG